jgi:hypothetical protein
MKKRPHSITPEAKPWPFSVGFPLSIRDSGRTLSICGVNRGNGWPILCEVPKGDRAEWDAQGILSACTDKIERYVGKDANAALLTACEQAEHWLAEELAKPGEAKPDEILRVLREAIEKAKGGA